MYKEHNIGYNATYDAFFDLESKKWLEGQCSSPTCRYCVGRPATAEGLHVDHTCFKERGKVDFINNEGVSDES